MRDEKFAGPDALDDLGRPSEDDGPDLSHKKRKATQSKDRMADEIHERMETTKSDPLLHVKHRGKAMRFTIWPLIELMMVLGIILVIYVPALDVIQHYINLTSSSGGVS